jgi:hypothetical protein
MLTWVFLIIAITFPVSDGFVVNFQLHHMIIISLHNSHPLDTVDIENRFHSPFTIKIITAESCFLCEF